MMWLNHILIILANFINIIANIAGAAQGYVFLYNVEYRKGDWGLVSVSSCFSSGFLGRSKCCSYPTISSWKTKVNRCSSIFFHLWWWYGLLSGASPILRMRTDLWWCRRILRPIEELLESLASLRPSWCLSLLYLLLLMRFCSIADDSIFSVYCTNY